MEKNSSAKSSRDVRVSSEPLIPHRFNRGSNSVRGKKKDNKEQKKKSHFLVFSFSVVQILVFSHEKLLKKRNGKSSVA